MKKLFFSVLLSAAWLLPLTCYAGPFGLEPGMSRADVIQKIGKAAIIEERKDYIDFKTVPVRSIYFDDYLCFFDVNNKLAAIHASKVLTTKTGGEDLRGSFDELKTGLEDKYGAVLYVTGSRSSTVTWANVAAWSVFTGAYWAENSNLRKNSQIHQIALELKRIDNDHGILQLTYDFTTLVEDPL